MVTLTIPGRIPSKKNSKQWIIRGSKRFLVPSNEHRAWHDGALWMLKGAEKVGETEWIRARFFFPDNRVKDLSNAWESVGDLLVDAGILADDCWQKTGPLMLEPGGIDKENPRVELELHEKAPV
jgi:hypothetical protein